MYNKPMPAEEQSPPLTQEAERGLPSALNKLEEISGSSVGEQPIPGPSRAPPRQGFCSFCQALYSSVEQHILSSRHREVVRRARTHPTSGSLLERFLQDVIQHHPHHYNDTRPTHADLPSLTSPLVPREVLSDVDCASEDDENTVGTREETLSSDEESCRLTAENASPGQYRPSQTGRTALTEGASGSSTTTSSSDGDRVKAGLSAPSAREDAAARGRPPLAALPALRSAQPRRSRSPPPRQCSGALVQFHRKAHRKTDRRRSSSSSASRDIPRDQALCGEHHQTVENVIEEVIKKYCQGISPQTHQGDEDSFHLSLGSITDPDFSDAGTSMEWDVPVQAAPEVAKAEVKDFGCLMEVHIDLEDQKYKVQLDTALNLLPKAGEERRKAEPTRAGGHASSEEVLPALPHVPRSFVGKTWSQVMYEDDLKIESMVREFREGRFRCYFDSESLAKFGRRTNKGKGRKGRVEEEEEWGAANMLPLTDCPEDDPVCHNRELPRRARHRTWRLASRCQVVKVSHGTQTTPRTGPVVRQRAPEDVGMSTVGFEGQQGLDAERTPCCPRTRLCALTLPEAYSKIMSPLQPKTLVYVLSSPDPGQGPPVPASIRRAGMKRKSSDNKAAPKYKYKKTPLKYYDPLTNRILKTPPKGVAACKPKAFPHIRQLFRSLSPDINKEKQFVERKEVALWGPSRGRAGSAADFCASTSGSCLESVGASEPGSSISSRRALFSRSSLSSSSRFLLGGLTPTPSHADATSARVLASDPNERVQTRARKGQVQGRQSPRLKEKSLVPTKGAVPPYRPKKESVTPTTRRGQARSELPMKPCSRGRPAKPAAPRKGVSRDVLPSAGTRGKTRYGEPSRRAAGKERLEPGKAMEASPRSPGMEKKSSGVRTRSSARHSPVLLTTQRLRKRAKR